MRITEAFPSSTIKADDLKGRLVSETIDSVEFIAGAADSMESKLLIGFLGRWKKLDCDERNAITVAKLHGNDTDYWIGKRITLRPNNGEVEVLREKVWAVPVRFADTLAKGKSPPESESHDDFDGPF